MCVCGGGGGAREEKIGEEMLKRFDTGRRRRGAKDERGQKSAVKENGHV